MSEVKYLVTWNSLRGKNQYQKKSILAFFLLPVEATAQQQE